MPAGVVPPGPPRRARAEVVEETVGDAGGVEQDLPAEAAADHVPRIDDVGAPGRSELRVSDCILVATVGLEKCQLRSVAGAERQRRLAAGERGRGRAPRAIPTRDLHD